MHYSTEETQICRPELGAFCYNQNMDRCLPFHYWCYRTMEVSMDINSDSSIYQIYPSNLYC